MRLQCTKARKPLRIGDGKCFGEARDRVVGRRNSPDHTRVDVLREGRQRLFKRCVQIIGVAVVEVDVVGAEPLQ